MKDLPAPGHIHTGRIGTGARDVLAIHCTLAHSGAWKGLATALPETTFHVFDMPSHGRSADWDAALGDYQDQGTDAALGLLTRRMDVIGHSFGATIALRLAVERPDLVRSLTLIEPVFFAVAIQDAPDLLAEHDARSVPFFEALLQGDTEEGARRFSAMWGDGPRWEDLPAPVRAAMVRAIPVVPACRPAIYDDRAALLAPGRLDRVTCPVQLLRGSATDPVIAVVNDGLARRLPDAVSLVVNGAGHMLPITHPGETAALMRDVFARA